MFIRTVCAIMDGVPDNIGDILSENVELPEDAVKVTLNFSGRVLGSATVKKRGQYLIANIWLTDPDAIATREAFSAVIGGVAFEKEDNIIARWSVDEIALTERPCDIRLPKLGDTTFVETIKL